jgi:tetratricopeptide (TPR) repeat protein
MVSSAEKIKNALTELDVAEKSYGIEDPRLIAKLDALAEIYHALGDFPSAEKYYLRSLAIKVQCSHELDPELANTFRKAGVLYRIQGKFLEAEKFYKQALKIVETICGSDSLEAARCFNYIAGLYNAQGDFQLAEKYLLKTLCIYQNEKSLEKFYLGSTFFALALICHKQNKSDEATHYKLLAQEALSGMVEPDQALVVSKQLVSLAMIYFQKHDFEKTETLFRHALILEEESLWTYSPSVTDGLMTLAQLCAAMQHFKEAETFYRMAQTKYEGAPHPNNRDLLNCLTRFATFHRFRQRYKEEAELLAKALQLADFLDQENQLDSTTQTKKIAEEYADALAKATAMSGT